MLYLIMTIQTGFLAWNIVEPQTFIGAIGFLIIWGILDYAFSFILMFQNIEFKNMKRLMILFNCIIIVNSIIDIILYKGIM